MKRFLQLIFIITLFAQVNAQNISQAEYFFDTDPGVGNGISVNVSSVGSDITEELEFDVSGLSIGHHIVSFRCKTDSGWSFTFKQSFIVSPQIDPIANKSYTELEYYFDVDPGIGNATPLSVNLNSDSELQWEADITGLQKGIHIIGSRFKNSLGIWGHTHHEIFIVNDAAKLDKSIVGFNTFIDTYENGAVPATVNPTADPNVFDLEIDLGDSLPLGLHHLILQAYDQVNSKSHLKNELFIINNALNSSLPKVVGGEYFIDSIQHPGEGVQFTLDSSATDIQYTFEIPMDTVSAGVHQLALRFYDENGTWNFVKSQLFIKRDQPTIYEHPGFSGVEYYFVDQNRFAGEVENSPKLSSEIEFIDFGENGDSATIQFEVQIPDSLQLGENRLVITGLDNEGRQAFTKDERFDICLTVPETPETFPVTICEGQGAAQLIATSNFFATGFNWYDRISGENSLNTSTDSTWTTPELTKDTSFYVAYKYDGSCPEGNRTKIDVFVYDSLPKPFIKSVNKVVCPFAEVVFTPENIPTGGSVWWYMDNIDSVIFEGDTLVVDSISTNPHQFTAKNIVKSVTGNEVCISPDSLKLAIVPKICQQQHIVFPPISTTNFRENLVIPLEAYAIIDSNTSNRLPVRYEVGNPLLSQIVPTGDSLDILTVGVIKVTAYQDGNDTVQRAEPVEMEFTVQFGSNTLSLQSNSPVCTGTNLHLFADSLLNATYHLTGPNGLDTNVRELIIPNIDTNYSGTYKIVANRMIDQNLETYIAYAEIVVHKRAATLDILVEETGGCDDKAFILHGIGSDFIDYNWYRNGVLMIGADSSVFQPTLSGTYSVIGSNINNCFAQSSFRYINLDPFDIPEIERLDLPTRLQASPGANYQWYINNYFIAEGNEQVLPIFVNGTYKVQVENAEGCKYLSEGYEINRDDFLNITRFANINLSSLEVGELHVNPNPAIDYIDVIINKASENDFTYKLTSVSGVTLTEGRLYNNDGISYKHISLDNITHGFYLLHIRSNNFYRTLKIEVE